MSKEGFEHGITYKGEYLGVAHLSCIHSCIGSDAEAEGRDEREYTIWGLRPINPLTKQPYNHDTICLWKRRTGLNCMEVA